MKHWIFLGIFCSLNLFAQNGNQEANRVLSLSSAIVDHYFFVNDEELSHITQTKGGWLPVDHTTFENLIKKHPYEPHISCGGSGCNVVKALAKFNHNCTLIGKLGEDSEGSTFKQAMQRLGIDCQLEVDTHATGKSICYITPDGEHTFRSFRGAEMEHGDLHLTKDVFTGVRHFHLEGYQIEHEELASNAMKLAKENGATTSVDLANIALVRRHKNFIFSLLSKHVDIVFCNEHEAFELTGLEPEKACKALAGFANIAVVTMSERGSWIAQGTKEVYMPAFPVKVVDSTGARDFYAAGFIHGFLKDEPIKTCSYLGSLFASYVIQDVGTDLPQGTWDTIKLRIVADDMISRVTDGLKNTL